MQELKDIREHCPRVSSLYLGYCEEFSDSDVAMLKDMPLTHLNISGTKVTNRGLRALVDMPLKELIARDTNILPHGLTCFGSLLNPDEYLDVHFSEVQKYTLERPNGGTMSVILKAPRHEPIRYGSSA